LIFLEEASGTGISFKDVPEGPAAVGRQRCSHGPAFTKSCAYADLLDSYLADPHSAVRTAGSFSFLDSIVAGASPRR
jgi:hypothetical protein